ncbi:MAG: hypothetical protein IT356_03805 [Gemmatimonadaceae bacterium]|nr:hypothetical protein [Gemmatimonadaceae bacterium]
MIAGLVAGCRLAMPFAPAGGTRMNADRLVAIVRSVDPDADRSEAIVSFTFRARHMLLLMDEDADRMRIITPVAESASLAAGEPLRLLQANFDTALDVRYAVARGKVWSAFLHPLGTLTEEELRSGIAQVVALAATYGGAYSSGGPVFRGGDSAERYERGAARGE